MRLSLKYPGERVPLSFDFRPELGLHRASSIEVHATLAAGSRVKDLEPAAVLDAEPWIEDGVIFQLVRGGLHGADYRITASVERDDGLVFQKLSILPVREE